MDVRPIEILTAVPDRPTAERFGRLLETWTALLLKAIRDLGAGVMEHVRARLVQRVVERTASGGIPITASHMERYRVMFEPPTDEELGLFDPPLEPGVS